MGNQYSGIHSFSDHTADYIARILAEKPGMVGPICLVILTSAEKKRLQEMIDKHGRQKPESHGETCWYGLIPLRWCTEGGLECFCCLGSEGCGDCAGDGCECCCDC